MGNWHVVAVEGSNRELRAFVAGFLADRKADPSAIVLGDDVGLEKGSLGDRMRALLHGGHHAILVSDELAGPLQDSIAHAGSGVGLRIVDRHSVATGSFAFAAEVYSRDMSAEIRAIVKSLPPGVGCTQHGESEEEHADAKGLELYTPVHHYAYRTRGTLEGPVTGILEILGRLAMIEALQLEPLHLA